MPAWKRCIDLSFVLLVLPFALLIALFLYSWVKSVSPGHVLFRQTRIGRGGKPFTMYKFRSMKPDAASDLHENHVKNLVRHRQPMVKLDLLGDPRLIKGGCIMRMSGLDELPQLINVLKGEMSLIGPRPCMPSELSFYESKRRQRFSLQPGLTGLWQVRRTESTTFPAMVEMDEEYLKRMSPWLDLEILAKTPGVLCRQMKACKRQQAASFSRGHALPPQPPLLPNFARQTSSSRKLRTCLVKRSDMLQRPGRSLEVNRRFRISG